MRQHPAVQITRTASSWPHSGEDTTTQQGVGEMQSGHQQPSAFSRRHKAGTATLPQLTWAIIAPLCSLAGCRNTAMSSAIANVRTAYTSPKRLSRTARRIMACPPKFAHSYTGPQTNALASMPIGQTRISNPWGLTTPLYMAAHLLTEEARALLRGTPGLHRLCTLQIAESECATKARHRLGLPCHHGDT